MARCPSCDTACANGATECGRCGAIIAIVCAQCDAGNPKLARFCCGCGSRLEASTDGQAASSLAGPERRQLTVLFCDVVDSTALGRKLEPEEWHRVIQRLHSQCGELVAKNNGYVAQYLGDGLLAYFGYPIAAEDAPRRAVLSGLEISKHVSGIRLRPPETLKVRIGIHTGPVIVGNIGSRRHQESLALGETPTLAARLQERAPPGGVAISTETKRLVDGFFDCEELGRFQFKGFAEALSIYRVLSQKSPRTRLEAASAAGLTKLVGRSVELNLLKDAWASVSRGGASAVLALAGEPGIGKSRLIHELTRFIGDGVTVLELRCFEHVRTSLLHPIIDCLQRAAEHGHLQDREATRRHVQAVLEPARLDARETALVLWLFGVPIDTSLAPPAPQLREATLEATAVWLTGARAKGPRLVIVEDLQWADAATLELLGAIFARPPEGVLFVLSARPEFVMPWKQVSSLTLGRLGKSEMRELVTLVAHNKPLPSEVVERLATRSECIPLFLEEMTKTVIDSGLIRETDVEYVLNEPMRDSAIPATLYDSLTGRLDQLGHGKPVAQLAAVLGREFRYTLFEAVWKKIRSAPDIRLSDALERLVGAQLLHREGTHADALYQFRHSLLQEAAYHSLLRNARQEYHRFAARAIVESFPARAELEPELVAYHFAGAEDHRHAVEFWGKAGERALGAAAYVEAISHYQAGIGELSRLEPSADASRMEVGLRTGLGLTLITSRGFASREVEETYARAAELCHVLGDEIPVRVLYGIWAVNLVRADLVSTSRLVPNMERLAASAPDAGARLVGLASLATFSFWRGDYRAAVSHGVTGMSLVDAADPKEQYRRLLREYGFEGIFYPFVYLAWSQAITGDVTAAKATCDRATELSARVADPYVTAATLAFNCTVMHELGDFQEAARLAEELAEVCVDQSFPFWQALGLIVRGACLLEARDFDAAVPLIEQGIQMYRGTGATAVSSYHLRYLAEAYLLRGEVERALTTLRESLTMMHSNLDCNFEPEVLRLTGEALLASGDIDGGLQALEAALALSKAQGARLLELKAATSLSQALLQRGDTRNARPMLNAATEPFSPLFQSPHLRKATALLDRL